MSTHTWGGERQRATGTLLREFRRTVGGLSPEARDQIVTQARVLIDQIYVHLPLKRAMHAVDPVQRLRILQMRAADLKERQFHDEMIAIFTALRDLHTRYILPAVYRGKTAVLPFRVQEFLEAGQPRYVVTEAEPALIADARFQVGVLVVRWNGVAMERAVEVNGNGQAGSNVYARHARGLNTMTKRPIDTSALPDEDWVEVGYVDHDGHAREARFEWRVIEPDSAPGAVDPHAPDEPHALALGLDIETEAVRRARKTVFAPDRIDAERRVVKRGDERPIEPGESPGRILEESPVFPDTLQFQRVRTPHGEFGHLRIRNFLPGDVGRFVVEVQRILELLPQEGLIVDVRGNPGGVIMNAEVLLQLFTPRRIEPERMQLINTPLMRELCERVPNLRPWKSSIAESVETVMSFSDGFPLTPVEACNAFGQRYHGPCVLIVDALCYSAADIFIAGWQDHRIGPILGTSKNTGAGGANCWGHPNLAKAFEGADSRVIGPLPERVSFSVAIRRTTRVGEQSGVPLEDLGVPPDHVHHLTLNDLLNDNKDLLAKAGQLLAQQPVRALAAEAVLRDDGLSAGVKVTTRGISRLDAYVDDRPQHTLDVADGQIEFDVPVRPDSSPTLDLRGFDESDLVAARRLGLGAESAQQ